MKKVIASMVFFLMTFHYSFAEIWDILYVKFMHSPVVTTVDNSSQILAILQKWFVVLDLWQNWDYTQVMLTDGKKWYMLNSHLENYTFSNYKINGNKGVIWGKTYFYSWPNLASKKITELSGGTEFFIMHVNYINSRFLKVKIINGPFKNKIWYIEWNNINISHISSFKSEIEKFIEKYTQNQTQVTFLHANTNQEEYIPLFWEESVNTTVSVFQQQVGKNNTIDNNLNSENDNDFSEFFNILNDNIDSINTFSSWSSSQNNISNSSSQTDNDLNEFFNLLNGNINSSNTSSSWNSSQNNISTSTPQTNNDLNEFFNLLNGSLYPNETNSGNNYWNQSNDLNEFFNLLNGSLNTNTSNSWSSSNDNDLNEFFNLLDGSLYPNETNSGNNYWNQNNDLNEFFNLLNGGF